MSAVKLRLFPVVLSFGAVLLVAKGFGIAIDARAQAGQQNAATAKNTPAHRQAAVEDAAIDDSSQPSAAAIDVLTTLSRRRAELDARERELTMRENLIAAAAKRADAKIAQLKDLQTSIERLLGQRDAAEQKQFDQLVKSYSSMKPRDAAHIFNGLSDDVLVPVAGAMKADVLGAILAQMQAEEAQKLTVKLAGRLKPPQHASAAAQVQPSDATSSSQLSPNAAVAASAVKEQPAPASIPASANKAAIPPSGAPAEGVSGSASTAATGK